MANNLNILEVTLAQISNSAHAINVVGPLATNARAHAYQPAVVRVTDHNDNVALEEDDPTKMALFESSAHGQPWRADKGHKEHRIWPLGELQAATPIIVGTDGNLMNIIYPDFNYANFK